MMLMKLFDQNTFYVNRKIDHENVKDNSIMIKVLLKETSLVVKLFKR